MDKIICVGKNYLDHAKELGDAVPSKPVLFLKPPSVLKTADSKSGQVLAKLPQGKGGVHHECEIVFRLDQTGRPTDVTLGLDMTLRELQSDLKKQGLPWEISKVFSDSAIIGPWLKLPDHQDILKEVFTLSINGALKQKGQAQEMRYSPEDCIRYAKECFPLCDGDLLFTGTPAGVGPVVSGQVAELKWGSQLSYRVQFE
jgi:2-keto-4-pentenoate hydratase/2-oxohepta-3-ene-1,7-dioic acid hydratase in catechol pathway